MNKSKSIDFWVLSAGVLFITFHPFYLHGELNLFELGLYLPGIDAIFNGLIPYKDFYYLRGPFELYVPSALMFIFDRNVAVLSTYFYVGTVATLLISLLIAREVLTTRLFLYLLTPVLVAKTFPRVVFTYWGGARFALGLIAVYCAIKYFKNQRKSWIVWSGFASALSLWTSIEIGVYACSAVVGTLVLAFFLNLTKRSVIVDGIKGYGLGFLTVSLPYVIYLMLTQSFIPYVESILITASNLYTTFPETEETPKNIIEAFLSMVNPVSKNFRHLTPTYCFLFFWIFVTLQYRKNKLKDIPLAVICLALYGCVFFIISFRSVWSSNFEMALQPEKILLFFLLERAFVFIQTRKGDTRKQSYGFWKVGMINFLILGVFMSSIMYPLMRFQRRFFSFQVLMGEKMNDIKPLKDVKSEKLELSRVNGMTLPHWQAEDIKQLKLFLDRHTSEGEEVLMFPEMGAYNFIINRPFVGRFPIVTASWLSDDWHREFLFDVEQAKPRYAVVPKELPEYFHDNHFKVVKNREKYDEVDNYIQRNYNFLTSTPTLNILKRK